MALRKLGQRLREHDWFAALLELTIVIAGILIALQVSNWNQDRHDRTRADNYLRRLHTSLLGDRESMDATLGYWRQVSEYGRGAMAHAESGQRVHDSNWKTVLAYYQASQLMPFELDETTFVEMRSTGDLTQVGDELLRTRLAAYYSITSGGSIRANVLRHDPEYRRQIRGLTPWPVQEYIWSRCFRQLEGIRQELLDCPAPITETAAADLLDTFRTSPTLVQQLRFWMSTLRVSELAIGDTRKRVDALVRDVQAARSR